MPLSPSSLAAALEDAAAALGRAAVLVVGDIMLDKFVYGDVHRISPESPVPVLTVRHEDLMLGGAGNVLSNLAGLNVPAHILAVTGDDAEAAQIKKLVADRGADPAGLVAAPARFTTVKTRFLAAHQQLLRTDYERTDDIPADTADALISRARLLIPQCGAVVLSDYGKGVLTKNLISALIKIARQNNVPVLVDPKNPDYGVYDGASVVTPNRKELGEATGRHALKSDQDITAAAQQLIRDSGIAAVVATRSQDGMTIVRQKPGLNLLNPKFEDPVHLRTEALEVFDVSGAGDTVIATLAAALAAGANLVTGATLANIAAGLVVAKVGTAPVRRGELIAALHKRTLGQQDGVIDRVREAPLCDADEAAEAVRRWKAQGLRVGFTNGCFDILHAGHVGYLNRAREKCDRLVVGLNTDDSVRRLKGPDRPLNDERARAAVLGALGAVDMVVLFGGTPKEDDKPLRLIEILKPDLYVKGGDYQLADLPEAPFVKSYGGTVDIMPLTPGHSTTNLIARAGKRQRPAA